MGNEIVYRFMFKGANWFANLHRIAHSRYGGESYNITEVNRHRLVRLGLHFVTTNQVTCNAPRVNTILKKQFFNPQT